MKPSLPLLLTRRCPPPHPSPSLSPPRDVLPTLSFFRLIVMKATQRSRTGSPSSGRNVVSHPLPTPSYSSHPLRVDCRWHLPLWLLFFGVTVSILTLLFLLTGSMYPVHG